MSLSPGTRIGPYEVGAQLGAGGMGEVYRAHDTKLNRDVAIKVLAEIVATDPERLARFHREAQVLASLNHPNIAHVYGAEDASSTYGLVMELVEGRHWPTASHRVPYRSTTHYPSRSRSPTRSRPRTNRASSTVI